MKWIAAARLATPALALFALAGCNSEPVTPQQRADRPAVSEPALVGKEVRIVALGDSLFAGYGLEPGQSYPARLESALRARGINARIMNAGVSGDTTAGGLQRLAFTLNGQTPKLAIISLGGNDMLRALPPEQTRANLEAILTELDQRRIKVVLLGMLAAPNLGADYAGQFNAIYPALAKKHGAVLVPFFLQPLVGKPALVQADHVHPTLQGIDLLVGSTADAVAGAVPKGE
jgi:acyl-CoA thioesterase-1